MTIAAFVTELNVTGIHLFVEGDRLLYEAPPGALTDNMRTFIATHRAGIVAHLQQATSADKVRPCPCPHESWRDAAPTQGRIRTTCSRCGRFIGYRPT